MYSLDIITSDRFQNPPARTGEHNRDCSFHVTRSGIILHSARQRSTLFVSRDAPTYGQVSGYLKRAGQRRVNAFIEAFFLDAFPTVEDCLAHARAV